ncbi:hypothetical protein V492_03017 [Pseudogymnoascus sp. VKM F-4246]|nr:hypothetical protein V492_03017 [Pseudogymnoascus sp. VKM F-4246]
MTMNFVTFNQDYSRLAIGTSKGFRIYHSDPEFRPAFKSDEDNVSIIEMMFSTSLVALVLSPRRLVIRNTKVSELESCGPPHHGPANQPQPEILDDL